MAPPVKRRSRPANEVWMLVKDRKLMARLMAIQGYSQRRLAFEAGFASHSYLARLLSGEKRSCTAERAVAIAHLLSVPLDSLFLSNVSTDGGQTGTPREATFRREDVPA